MGTRLMSALAPDERQKVETSVQFTRNSNRKPVPVHKVKNSPSQAKFVTLPDATGDCYIT